jgi:hypothetical protein
LLRSLLVIIVARLCLVADPGALAQTGDAAQLQEAPSLSSQPLPSTRRVPAVPFHKEIFWTLVAFDAASAVTDGQTSRHNEQTYPEAREENSWLYGQRPSLGRYYGMFALIDGGGSFLSYKMLHSRHKILRTAGWIVMAELIGQHTVAWIGNVSGYKTVPAEAHAAYKLSED